MKTAGVTEVGKGVRKQFLVLAGTFLIIALSMLVLVIQVQRFNRQERVQYFSAANTKEKVGDCRVTIQPRGGSTDAWMKSQTDENGTDRKYAGVIYEMMLYNFTDKELLDWKIQVEVPEDCMINNAWCGEIEFHQHVGGDEKVQVLDLRRYAESKSVLEVDAFYIGTDLMVPLEKGDYFVYLPSAAESEDRLKASDLENRYYQNVNVGFIVYHEVEDTLSPLSFPKAVLTYKLHKNLTDSRFFRVLIAAFALWIMWVLATIAFHFKTKKLVQEAENDAQIIKQTMLTFMGFIDAKDSSTNGHSRRVAVYSRRIALKYGMSEEEAQKVYYIGLMHDCGKIGIPDSILNKPGELSDEEYEIIKTHTTEGGKILKDFTSIEHIKDGALYHHERFDGKGYPGGLAGEQIPLVARIICVADSFDAMNSDRCYRKRLTREEIEREITQNRGTQFDPEIADCLLQLLQDGEIVCERTDGIQE